MELYILKSSITLTTLYLFYWFFLRKETYHSWNRMYLVISVVVSLIFPFLSYPLQQVSVNNFSTLLEPVIIKGEYNPVTLVPTSEKINLLSIIYISGALFFALRFISSIAKIQWLYFRFPRVNFMGFKTVLLDSDQSPFTFFNVLFISRKDYEIGKIDEMIVHETAHKNHGHSVDVIMLEIFTILQWFNPVIWLFRQSLKLEHEYIADQAVLKKGFDVAGYQKMLFEKSLGVTSFDLTNHFNYSLLKKRLKMMTIHKTNMWIRLKYVLSIPAILAIFLLLAVNINSSAQKEENIAKYLDGKPVYLLVDEQAKFKNGGLEGLREFANKNLVYPKSALEKKYSAKLIVQFVIDYKGKVKDPQIIATKISDENGLSGSEGSVSNTPPPPPPPPAPYPGKNEKTSKTSKVEKVEKVERTETKPTKPGLVIDPTALNDLKAEAIRVIKSIPDCTPAKKDGKNVNQIFVMPIAFQYDK